MSNEISFDINLVPEEWSVIPCGVFFKEKSIKNTEGEINLSVYRDYGVIPKDSRDDNHNRVSEDTSNYKLVEPGDFVLNKMKGWSGSLGVSDYRGIVSPSYTVLEPVEEIHNKYFHYLLRSETYRQIYESLSYGIRIGQWELRYHDFKQIPSLYPPLEEQKLIARYLDKKTEQIDRLVEKIQRKIDLLKEQRTSLINHYVTKGLDPNVEMKDSGVEWIGEIPKHWGVKKLKYISKQISEKRIPVDGDIKISPENVESDTGRIINFYSDYDSEGQIFQSGDILFNKLRVYLNKVVLCEFEGLSMGEMIVVRPALLENGFLYRVLNSSGFINQVNSLSEGVKLPRPSVSGIFDSYVPTPPSDEQLEIYQIIKQKTDLIDQVIIKHNCQIDSIREYRQSLISSAVTGKIRITEDMI